MDGSFVNSAAAGIHGQHRAEKGAEETGKAAARSCHAAALFTHLGTNDFSNAGVAGHSAVTCAHGTCLCCMAPPPEGQYNQHNMESAHAHMTLGKSQYVSFAWSLHLSVSASDDASLAG